MSILDASSLINVLVDTVAEELNAWQLKFIKTLTQKFKTHKTDFLNLFENLFLPRSTKITNSHKKYNCCLSSQFTLLQYAAAQ